MKYVAIFCRILLGLLFVVSGANIIHPFHAMEMPSGLPGEFTHAMVTSGWMRWIGVFQLLGGLLVLIGFTVPMGLCILVPITVNILCFHIFLTGGAGIAGGALALVFELVLLYAYRPYFSGVLSVKARPVE